MAKYEILYIIRPNIEEEAKNALVARFDSILTDISVKDFTTSLTLKQTTTLLLKSLTVFQKSTLTFFVT